MSMGILFAFFKSASNCGVPADQNALLTKVMVKGVTPTGYVSNIPVQLMRGSMLENQKIRSASVIGPLGEALTLDALPPAGTTRWVVRRKAEVVAAVNGGLLTVNEACRRYSISLEEFTGWQRAVWRSGMPGLRVTRLKHYRDQYERQEGY